MQEIPICLERVSLSLVRSFPGVAKTLTLVACMLFGTNVHASDDLNRFLKEAPLAWAAVTDAYDGKSFDMTENRVDRITAPVKVDVLTVTRRFEVHSFGEWSRLNFQSESIGIDTEKAPPPNATVQSLKSMPRQTSSQNSSTIRNNEYSASINLDATPTLSALFIEGAGGFKEQMHWIDRRCYPSLAMDFTDGAMRSIEGLPGVVPSSDPGTWRIGNTSRVVMNGVSMVKLELKYSSVIDRKLLDAIEAEVFVILDPARSWSVVQSQRKGKNNQAGTEFFCKVDHTYSLADPSAFHPEKTSIESTIIDSEGTMTTLVDIKLSPLRDSNYAKADCYLSAFGLPEPTYGNSRWWAIPLVAIISLSLLVFWNRKRSRKSV